MQTYLVHVGYVVTLCAFLARDILHLRGLLVVAQTIVATYAFLIGVQAIGAWNSLFACINIVWVVQILRARRAVHLPPDLRALYERHFAAMAPPEFIRWWKMGHRETMRERRLTWAGSKPESLFFLLSGSVRVSRDGTPVTDLPAGYFVAEMSLLTGSPANADVDTIGDVEVMRWATADLRALGDRNPILWTKIQSAIGHDLVEKIRRSEH